MTLSSQNHTSGSPSGLLPFRVPFTAGEEYQLLLDGPPQTCGMRCGRVVLKPEEAAGEHTTGSYEEVLVILEGEGELWFEDFPSLKAEKEYLALCSAPGCPRCEEYRDGRASVSLYRGPDRGETQKNVMPSELKLHGLGYCG